MRREEREGHEEKMPEWLTRRGGGKEREGTEVGHLSGFYLYIVFPPLPGLYFVCIMYIFVLVCLIVLYFVFPFFTLLIHVTFHVVFFIHCYVSLGSYSRSFDLSCLLYYISLLVTILARFHIFTLYYIIS